jgi:hypothetical protein
MRIAQQKYAVFFLRLLLSVNLCLFQSSESHAQANSGLRISLLTCSPGDELYAIFGHSAMRVIDTSAGTDIVFNYGTFNFNEEDFYIKFMRGKLRYYLSTQYFADFRDIYLFEGRKITEQVLALSETEKVQMFNMLVDNLREEKKYYLYDFFLDNCTTRLRDLIVSSHRPSPLLPAVMPENTTFRNAIHQYLDKGNKDWSKLGIDILLGARTDAIMTSAQQQFLPDNLMIALDNYDKAALISETTAYESTLSGSETEWFTPMLFFSALLLIILILHYPGKKTSALAEGTENFILFMTGLLGLLLVLMWAGTDHKMTKDNYNLLWAWPSHLLFVLLSRRLKLVRMYFSLNAIFLVITLGAWFFLPQKMNPALIPFVILLCFLSFRRGLQNKP